QTAVVRWKTPYVWADSLFSANTVLFQDVARERHGIRAEQAIRPDIRRLPAHHGSLRIDRIDRFHRLVGSIAEERHFGVLPHTRREGEVVTVDRRAIVP